MAYTDPTLPTLPDIRIATTPVRTVTVADTGNTTTNGTNLQTALTDAHFGDDIILTAGATYLGNFTLPVPTGTVVNGAFENYVTVRSSLSSNLPAGTRVTTADVANMATITSSTAGGTSAIVLMPATNAVHHYRFIGLNFVPPQVAAFSTCIFIGPPSSADRAVSANYCSFISFERILLNANEDFGCQKGMYLLCQDARVLDSSFYNCMTAGSGESNCFLATYDTRRLQLDNNDFQGMGENVFIGPDCFGSVPVSYTDSGSTVWASGVEYKIPTDITITRNYIHRKLKWKSTDATYEPMCETAGTGTVSSSTTTLTFSASQTGLTGKYIRGVTSGKMAKVTAGSGTSWTVAWVVGTTFTGSESWRYNAGDLTCKNLLEFKSGSKVKVDSNVLQNGWNDGQLYAIQMGGRSFGWLGDITFTNNRMIDTTGLALSVGDYSAGTTFGASPYATKRVNVSNNSWENLNSVTGSLSGAIANGMSLKVHSDGVYGEMVSGYTVSINSTGTGAGKTVTSTIADLFESYHVGWEIRYGVGRGIITAVAVGGASCTVTVSVGFPDTSGHLSQGPSGWMLDIPNRINTRFGAGDSWKFEHNSFVGANSRYAFMPQMNTSDQSGLAGVPCTNFIWQNNMQYMGLDSGSGVALYWQDHGIGVGALTTSGFTDATRVWEKNVWFGPDYVSTFSASPVSATAGSGFTTNKTAVHIPDQAGATSGGSVGFVDYAGGNYAVSGTYATAATDGTMIGCNYTTMSTTWTNVIAGVADSGGTSPFRYLPIRWP